jgi:hypothetical protein
MLKTDHQVGSRPKTAGGPFTESVSLHVTAGHWRPFLKKEDPGGQSGEPEDTEEAEDRPPGRIKTGNGKRTFPRVRVTPRDTST